jgi:hypothetical protein
MVTVGDGRWSALGASTATWTTCQSSLPAPAADAYLQVWQAMSLRCGQFASVPVQIA